MKENESEPLFLAKISKFEDEKDEHGCYTKAQVIPVTSDEIVTRPFSILWICRGNLGKLEVDSLVVCGRFADGSGIIICRADGEHTNIFPKDLVVEGDMEVQGDATISGISFKGHTHTGVHGETSTPR